MCAQDRSAMGVCIFESLQNQSINFTTIIRDIYHFFLSDFDSIFGDLFELRVISGHQSNLSRPYRHSTFTPSWNLDGAGWASMTFQHPSIYVVNYQKITFSNAHHFISMGNIHDITLFYEPLDFICDDYVKIFSKNKRSKYQFIQANWRSAS